MPALTISSDVTSVKSQQTVKMFSGRRLRELVRERLAAAAEEIITEFEQTINKYEEEIECQRRLLTSCCCPQIKIHRIDFPQQAECKEEEEKETLCETETDALQLHDCKEERVLTVQQLCKKDRNSSLDQEEQDPAQVKEEEEELCTSQEEEHFLLKQETDTFMVTPTDEDNDNNETDSNSEQLLCHISSDTESQDRGAGKNLNPGASKHEEPKPKKRLHRNRSDSNNVDSFSMSENQCDTDRGEKSVKCSIKDKDFKNESKKKKCCTVNKLHVCNTCGKKFSKSSDLSAHERIHTDTPTLDSNPWLSKGDLEPLHEDG
ncbi:uncharacterized protein KZ484_011035 [Pholidichthys leucotaenia]